MIASSQEIGELFGADGPLATAISGFSVRAEQVEMAQVIADALAQRQRCVIEAGTGIGRRAVHGAGIPEARRDRRAVGVRTARVLPLAPRAVVRRL